jgi:hypothetical protein
VIEALFYIYVAGTALATIVGIGLTCAAAVSALRRDTDASMVRALLAIAIFTMVG